MLDLLLGRSLDRLASERIIQRLERISPEARSLWLRSMAFKAGIDGLGEGVSGGADQFTNFPYSTVQAGSTIIGSIGNPVTIVLGTGEGARFPTPGPFNVVLWPSGQRALNSNAEIVRATRSGDTLTTTARAQEGTSALATIAAGFQVMEAISARFLNESLTLADQKDATTDLVSSTSLTDILGGVVTLPKNTVGATGFALLIAHGDYLNNSGAARTLGLALRLGGTQLWRHTSTDDYPADADRRAWILLAMIKARNSTASQNTTGIFLSGDSGTPTTGIGTLARITNTAGLAAIFGSGGTDTTVDLTSDRLIELMAEHPASNASLSIRCFGAELIVARTSAT